MKKKMLALGLGLALMGAASAYAGPHRVAREDREVTPAARPVRAQMIKRNLLRLTSQNKCTATITCNGDGSGGSIREISGCSGEQLDAIVGFILENC